MFTGFATENSPAIQVWDFFRGPASGNVRLGLTDDCAPIQLFRTGGTTTAMLVYLPTCPIEGKIIRIVNQKWGFSEQLLNVYSSDRQFGTTSTVYQVGPGGSIDLIFSKNLIGVGTSSGAGTSGWTPLNFVGINASNYNAVALGNNSQATGASSLAFGDASLASGTQSYSIGSSATASTLYAAVFGGFSNAANGIGSTVIGAYFGNARSITGNAVFAASNSPVTSGFGISQTGLLILGVQTTDATATVLRSNSSAATTTNQLILSNNSAYVFQGTVIAARTAAGDTSGWKFEGTIKRGATAASTTLVAAVTPTVISQDAGAAAWVLAVTADTTNGGLAVTVTGAAATTIRWVCRLESTEVTF